MEIAFPENSHPGFSPFIRASIFQLARCQTELIYVIMSTKKAEKTITVWEKRTQKETEEAECSKQKSKSWEMRDDELHTVSLSITVFVSWQVFLRQYGRVLNKAICQNSEIVHSLCALMSSSLWRVFFPCTITTTTTGTLSSWLPFNQSCKHHCRKSAYTLWKKSNKSITAHPNRRSGHHSVVETARVTCAFTKEFLQR